MYISGCMYNSISIVKVFSIIHSFVDLYSGKRPYSSATVTVHSAIRNTILTWFSDTFAQYSADSLEKDTTIWRTLYLVCEIVKKTPSTITQFASFLLSCGKQLLLRFKEISKDSSKQKLLFKNAIKKNKLYNISCVEHPSFIDISTWKFPACPRCEESEIVSSLLLVLHILSYNLEFLSANQQDYFIQCVCDCLKAIQNLPFSLNHTSHGRRLRRQLSW